MTNKELISRQAAIDACLNGWNKDYKEIVEDIRALPPATPAEKVGQCENIGNIYECPCGYGWNKDKVVRYHFCPNCGRKVLKAESEVD